MTFDQFIDECHKLLEFSKEQIETSPLKDDNRWFIAYQRSFSPEQAVQQYRRMVQHEINISAAELKAIWDAKVKESGFSAALFIAMDKTGWAASFLAEYQQRKEMFEKEGFTMPLLMPELTVRVQGETEN